MPSNLQFFIGLALFLVTPSRESILFILISLTTYIFIVNVASIMELDL